MESALTEINSYSIESKAKFFVFLSNEGREKWKTKNINVLIDLLTLYCSRNGI